jgi:hypothetical protein
MADDKLVQPAMNTIRTLSPGFSGTVQRPGAGDVSDIDRIRGSNGIPISRSCSRSLFGTGQVARVRSSRRNTGEEGNHDVLQSLRALERS